MLNNISLIFSLISICYYFYLKVNYGIISFSKFFLVLGILLIVYPIIKSKIKKKKVLYKVLKMIISLFLIVFIITESLMVFYPKNIVKENAEYILILGAAVKQNTPSITLKGRLDTALNYLKFDSDCYIVVSGGKGDGESISESEAMKNYLVKNGIDIARIIEEDKSRNTYENFKYSKSKIEKHSTREINNVNIRVITTDFHVFRSKILSLSNGYGNISFNTSKSKISFIPVYYTREFFALWKTILLYR